MDLLSIFKIFISKKTKGDAAYFDKLTKYVDKGAKYLATEYGKNGYTKIKLGTLDLKQDNVCITGQLFHSYAYFIANKN